MLTREFKATCYRCRKELEGTKDLPPLVGYLNTPSCRICWCCRKKEEISAIAKDWTNPYCKECLESWIKCPEDMFNKDGMFQCYLCKKQSLEEWGSAFKLSREAK